MTELNGEARALLDRDAASAGPSAQARRRMKAAVLVATAGGGAMATTSAKAASSSGGAASAGGTSVGAEGAVTAGSATAKAGVGATVGAAAGGQATAVAGGTGAGAKALGGWVAGGSAAGVGAVSVAAVLALGGWWAGTDQRDVASMGTSTPGAPSAPAPPSNPLSRAFAPGAASSEGARSAPAARPLEDDARRPEVESAPPAHATAEAGRHHRLVPPTEPPRVGSGSVVAKSSDGASEEVAGEARPDGVGNLEMQARRLMEVRSAVREGRYGEALAKLRAYENDFAGGVLAEERDALLAIARCRSGSAAPSVEAEWFRQNHPRSPLRSRVDEACPRRAASASE